MSNGRPHFKSNDSTTDTGNRVHSHWGEVWLWPASAWNFLRSRLSNFRFSGASQSESSEIRSMPNSRNSELGSGLFNNKTKYSPKHKGQDCQGFLEENKVKEERKSFSSGPHSEGLQSITEFPLCALSCPYAQTECFQGESMSEIDEKLTNGEENGSRTSNSRSQVNGRVTKDDISLNNSSCVTGQEESERLQPHSNRRLSRNDSVSLWDLRQSLEHNFIPSDTSDKGNAGIRSRGSPGQAVRNFQSCRSDSEEEPYSKIHVMKGNNLGAKTHHEIEAVLARDMESKVSISQIREVSTQPNNNHNARDRRKSFAERYGAERADQHNEVFTSVDSVEKLTLEGPYTKQNDSPVKRCPDHKKKRYCHTRPLLKHEILHHSSIDEHSDTNTTDTERNLISNQNSLDSFDDCETDFSIHDKASSATISTQEVIKDITTKSHDAICAPSSLCASEQVPFSESIDMAAENTDASRTTDSSPGYSSTCSVSPISIPSDSSNKIGNDNTSSESLTSSHGNAKTGSIRSLTRIFRRSSSKHYVSSPSFCGYSLDRDYCVDQKTDLIFKSFLKPDTNQAPSGSVVTAPRSRSTHYSCRNNNVTQLRRQVMRKQYSDSVAVYYGQRMRRWRVKKQRSDSVNCPVDRAVLRRQDRIEEEFVPEDINERMTASNESRRGAGRSDRPSISVTELKEWRRSQQEEESENRPQESYQT